MTMPAGFRLCLIARAVFLDLGHGLNKDWAILEATRVTALGSWLL